MAWQLAGVAQVNMICRVCPPVSSSLWQLLSWYRFCFHGMCLVQECTFDVVLAVAALISAGSVPGCCFPPWLWDSCSAVFCVVSLHCRWTSSTHNLQTWTGGVHQTCTCTLTMQMRDDQSSRLVTWDSLNDPTSATKEALLQSVRFDAMQYTTFFLLSPASLWPWMIMLQMKEFSWNLFSLRQREACRRGFQLVTGEPQQRGIIELFLLMLQRMDSFAFVLNVWCLRQQPLFTPWAPFKEWLAFSGMTVVSELCYHWADWRTGIHFLHANKMLKQTTDFWAVGEHLGCLVCKSGLLCRPK